MIRFGIGLTAAIATLAALAPTAVASPYRRSCGNSDYGSVLGNTTKSNRVQSGPYHISMSAADAARIAKRIPPEEFGVRLKPRQVPCWMASSIAASAGNAWVHWSRNTGSVRVVGTGSFGSVPLGRFACTGRRIHQTVRSPPLTYHYTVRETCTQGHGTDRIASTFRIGTVSQP